MDAQEPMVTMTGIAVHNALGAVVQVYAAVVADYERQLGMLRSTIRSHQAADKLSDQRLKELEARIENGKVANLALAGQLADLREQHDRALVDRDKLQRQIDFQLGTERLKREIGDDDGVHASGAG